MEIKCNGVNLYCEVTGEGRPAVLLHGNGENCRIFDKLVKDMSANGYACYAIDSRCHGKSQKDLPLTYDDMTDDVASFILTLKLERPVVIGFSDGGIIALLLAAEYPDTVSRVVASGPNVTPDGLKPWFMRFIKFANSVMHDDKLNMMITQPNISADTLKKITVPTAVTGGARDIVSVAHLKYIADNIANSQLEIVKGAGHASYVVNTAKYYKIIKKYL